QMMFAVIVVLVALVMIVQAFGDSLASQLDKRKI
ncbi:MAG: ABC transporter permease, partial [Acinetobacter sp.]|nr:ABC transporter permease [Acinetobacter sp.]